MRAFLPGILWMFANAGWAQQAPGAPGAAPPERRSLPGILRINGVSLYGEGDALWLPGEGSGPTRNLWLFTGGGAGDVGLRFGRRTQFSADYRGGYSYNQRYSELNGAHHSVSLSFRTDPERRTVFTIRAAGESGLIADALFDPSYALAAARRASSTDQLARDLADNGADTLLNAPIDLALSAGRRRSGAVYLGLMRSHSRRFTSYLHAGVLRALHSYSTEQQLFARYPNATIAMADAGLTYSLSRRTLITGTVGYTRSYSRAYRMDWQSSGLAIERQLGRRSFASVQGGYVHMSDPTTGGFWRGSYTAGGALGTLSGYHTMALRFRRGVSDLHGLGSDRSIGLDGSWSWAPHARPWTLGSSLGFERVEGGGLRVLQAWIAQGEARRRLSAHFQLAFTAVYMTYSSPDSVGFTRQGVRISVAWTPGRERTP